MKKVIVYILIVCFVSGFCYFFRDYLFQKGLDTDEVPYKEITTAVNKDKFNVYLFYNDGDSQSESLKSYFYTLEPDILEKFSLFTFEVSSNEENKLLLNNIKELLNVSNEGIPYLIIGNQVLVGYSENDNIKIINLIEDESKLDIHYDVLEYVKVEQES